METGNLAFSGGCEIWFSPVRSKGTGFKKPRQAMTYQRAASLLNKSKLESHLLSSGKPDTQMDKQIDRISSLHFLFLFFLFQMCVSWFFV